MRFKYIFKRLTQRQKKIFYERLSEPIHLNILSIFALFGSFRTKVEYDLILRPQYAYCILDAADKCLKYGVNKCSIVEFGVASGTGILNMAYIAEKVSKLTGVQFEIYGFDSGKGMPPALDYRDHPEYYSEGNYPMDLENLKSHLPSNCKLHIGDLGEQINNLFNSNNELLIGFVSFDLDYYSSTKIALNIFNKDSNFYLPTVNVYVDDMSLENHSEYSGALLAVKEFNNSNMRKITKNFNLKYNRILKNPMWINQIYLLHVFDHIERSNPKRGDRYIDNPYL